MLWLAGSIRMAFFCFFQCQCGNHTDNSECPNVNSEINNIRNMNMNINIYIYVAYKPIDSFDPLLQAATSQAKLKNISARMLPGHFPHCDFLGPRNENPPSLLNRTTLGAAYISRSAKNYLASRSCLVLSRSYHLLVSYTLCSPWFSPEKAYSQCMQ